MLDTWENPNPIGLTLPHKVRMSIFAVFMLTLIIAIENKKNFVGKKKKKKKKKKKFVFNNIPCINSYKK